MAAPRSPIHPRQWAIPGLALALTFVLAACAEDEPDVDATCGEAFAAVPVIGELETLGAFEDAIVTIDLTIIACETIGQWESAAEERLAVEVNEPAEFIWARCTASAPPAFDTTGEASPRPDVEGVLLPRDTPLCLEAAEELGEEAEVPG